MHACTHAHTDACTCVRVHMHMYTNTHTLMHRSSVMGMEERGGVEEETEFDVM